MAPLSSVADRHVLCQFATTFPRLLAELLGRSSTLRRRFREETATELLLMGLLGVPASGVKVDFSQNEAKDGADMDWELDWNFVSPHDPGGGSYVRLLIQAKVAVEETRAKARYWHYAHLDYKNGQQAQKLMAAAKSAREATLPLYMMFHPQGALAPASKRRPEIAGVNLVPAELVEPVVTQAMTTKGGATKLGCPRPDKKVERWRPHFFTLHDLLCWPLALPPGSRISLARFLEEFLRLDPGFLPLATPAWHPDFVAERLNEITGRGGEQVAAEKTADADERPALSPRPIPADLRRAIDGEETDEERRALKRTRVILTSPVRRGDEDYEDFAERSRARRDPQQ